MTTCVKSGSAVLRRAVALCALGATLGTGWARADIAYDTISGHTTGTLRGFGFGTIFAEDVTLEPGAGRTLVGWRMSNYGNENYFGTMTMMFAVRESGETEPDSGSVFASVDVVVSAIGTVTTWIGDLPFIEAPDRRLWIMWTFGANTLGNSSLPSIGSDGGVPTAGATNDRIYVLQGSSSSWQTIEHERWVMRLDAVPGPSGIACVGLGVLACARRR